MNEENKDENIILMELAYTAFCPSCKTKREVIKYGDPFRLLDHNKQEEAWQKFNCWRCEIYFACRIAVKE